MTKKEIADLLLSKNDPALAKVNGSHVSEIWQDGEHTSTKAGELFRQRNLHTLRPGGAHPLMVSYLQLTLPHSHGENHHVFVPYEDADRLSKLITEWSPADG